MNKEEILKHLEALEREGVEIKAEQDNICHLLSLVQGGRADATYSHLLRLQVAVDVRIAQWNRACDLLEAEVRKLAA